MMNTRHTFVMHSERLPSKYTGRVTQIWNCVVCFCFLGCLALFSRAFFSPLTRGRVVAYKIPKSTSTVSLPLHKTVERSVYQSPSQPNSFRENDLDAVWHSDPVANFTAEDNSLAWELAGKEQPSDLALVTPPVLPTTRESPLVVSSSSTQPWHQHLHSRPPAFSAEIGDTNIEVYSSEQVSVDIDSAYYYKGSLPQEPFFSMEELGDDEVHTFALKIRIDRNPLSSGSFKYSELCQASSGIQCLPEVLSTN